VDRWAYVVVCSTSWTRGETVKLNDKLLRRLFQYLNKSSLGSLRLDFGG
jgi:hypothetical protein